MNPYRFGGGVAGLKVPCANGGQGRTAGGGRLFSLLSSSWRWLVVVVWLLWLARGLSRNHTLLSPPHRTPSRTA